MQAQAPIFTVLDAMTLCGVNTTIQFNGSNQAEHIATEVFNDDHQSVLDKTNMTYKMTLKHILHSQ